MRTAIAVLGAGAVIAAVGVAGVVLANQSKLLPWTEAHQIEEQVRRLREQYGPDVQIICCTTGSVACEARPKRK